MVDFLNRPSTNVRDPEISPEGPKETEPLSADVAAQNAQLVDDWADKLYNLSLIHI